MWPPVKEVKEQSREKDKQHEKTDHNADNASHAKAA